MTPNHMIRFKNNLTKGRIYKEKRNLPLFVLTDRQTDGQTGNIYTLWGRKGLIHYFERIFLVCYHFQTEHLPKCISFKNIANKVSNTFRTLITFFKTEVFGDFFMLLLYFLLAWAKYRSPD